MSFFINHIGWFVGLFFIVLFAVVGYYADKKEHENDSRKVDNNLNKVSNENDVSDLYAIKNDDNQAVIDQENIEQSDFVQDDGAGVDSVSDGVNSIEGFYDGLDAGTDFVSESNDYSINVDGSNNFNSNESISDLEWTGSDDSVKVTTPVGDVKEAVISEEVAPIEDVKENGSIVDNSLSFESINMTFEDLERKDVDIINDSMGVTNSDDGFISDYNSDDLDFYDNFNSIVQGDMDQGVDLGVSESINFDSGYDMNSNNVFDVAVSSNDNSFVEDNSSDSIVSDNVVQNNDDASSGSDDVWSL